MNWWQSSSKALNMDVFKQATLRQDSLTKPQGSLGLLETVAVRLAAQQGVLKPSLNNLWFALFAGDHGVVEEGVAAYPQTVTVQMLANFVQGGAAISVLAKTLGAHLEVHNVGTANPCHHLHGVVQHEVGEGTANFTQGPAMTPEQCFKALDVGRHVAERAAAQGCQLMLGGEMGIGNTTTASALACALLKRPVAQMIGIGTGLDADGMARKAKAIEKALAFHQGEHSVFDWLVRVGGFEVAALAGLYIGCAQQGISVLVDGLICSVAALVAVRLNPSVNDWLFYAHQGAEPGHKHVLEALGAEPLLQLGLRLGEGSGAALAVPLLRLACELHSRMATFAEASVATAHD